MENYKNQLINCGLTEHQATLYELLIKSGGLRASTIVRKIDNSLSRPMVYAVLNELVDMGLVEKDELASKVTRFTPAHPAKLQDLATEKRLVADSMIDAAASVIPRMVSEFNLVSNKPSVRFFEGKEGVRAVLNDSLTAKTPILSYTDVEAVEKHYKDVGDPYLKERARLGILKKLIVDDTPFARKLYKGSKETHSEVRLIPVDKNPHKVSMQIYDDKVSYLTFAPGKEVAVIIQDAEISAMQRHLFEQLYNLSSPLYTPTSDNSGKSLA